MNIVFAVDYTGTADSDDVLCVTRIVRLENERRAALTPPGTPLATNNAANLKASGITVLNALLTSTWLSFIDQARGETVRFTSAQVDQIKANLNARLNAGEAAATIVSDTAS